jgi:hypothetical protein
MAIKSLRTLFLESIQNQINQVCDFQADEDPNAELLSEQLETRATTTSHIQKRISPWEAATLSLLDKSNRFNLGLPAVKV